MTNGLLKAIGSGITRSGKDARLSILIYHRVLPQPDPMLPDELDAELFGVQMDALADTFNVLPLGEAVERLQTNSLPPRAACVTFDDGYANNATIALPMLQERSLTACFFVATGFLNGTCMWNDIVIEALRDTGKSDLDLREVGLGQFSIEGQGDRVAVMNDLLERLKTLNPEQRTAAVDGILETAAVDRPQGLMMSPKQVRALVDGGMEVGGHTVNHPILATLSDYQARDEIGSCKERLEEIVGRKVDLFAYPNGRPGMDFTTAHVAITRDLGFSAAVTTANGTARTDTNPFLLPRFTPWDRTPLRFTLRLYKNALQNRDGRHPLHGAVAAGETR